jgi:hypothetical protein
MINNALLSIGNVAYISNRLFVYPHFRRETNINGVNILFQSHAQFCCFRVVFEEQEGEEKEVVGRKKTQSFRYRERKEWQWLQAVDLVGMLTVNYLKMLI